MKITISTLAFIAGLGLAGGALAQDPPAGGPDAGKGNAPVKHMHTVNDGTARMGANSFTQNEARKHILNSGYSDVSGLAKGKDGVWRGTAMKGGTSMNVALDFKGNVSEGGPTGAPSAPMAASRTTTTTSSSSTDASATAASSSTAGTRTMHAHAMHRRHHHGRHHPKVRCANPGPNGAACSGRDRNQNGISDKEDRAIKAGAKP